MLQSTKTKTIICRKGARKEAVREMRTENEEEGTGDKAGDGRRGWQMIER